MPQLCTHPPAGIVLPLVPLLLALEGMPAGDAPAPLPAKGDHAASSPADPGSIITVIGNLDQQRSSITPALGATTYEIDSAQISLESQGVDAPFNQVMLRMPGIAQDQYEQVHLRGEHANIQFRINGVVLPEGLITFGQEIDTHFAASVALITGSLPAQYGLRTAGIMDITTKTGGLATGGSLSAYGGSLDTIRLSASYGGTVGPVDAYATVSGFHSAEGIDNPTASLRPIHDDTNQGRGFGYISWILDPTSRLTVIGSLSTDTFQIPDVPGQTAAFTLAGSGTKDSATLNDVQDQSNSYAVLAYQKESGAVSVQIAPYVRESHLIYTPDKIGDLEYTGVASSIDRTTLATGVQLDSSLPLNPDHTLRSGLAYSATKALIETNTLVFPTDANGNQTSTTPEAIIDNGSKLGSFYSLYLQDEWKLTNAWTINLGVRADAVQAYTSQQQISPRINTTLVLGGTTLHAGYSRYFTPPPLEAVSQETVSGFIGTSNAAASTQNDPVKCERANYFDAGISQRIGSHVQIGLDGYYKDAQDQLDEGQFGTAIILSPFNFRYGRVMGGELTAGYTDGGLSAYGNLALSRAQGEGIDSAQFLFSAAELAYAQDHWIYLDHDQRWTASSGIAYRFPCRTTIMLDGIFGTGLRNGFDNTTHLPDYFTFNLGLSQEWRNFTARIDVVNLLDRIYEIRDGSGVGVAAPSYGPRRGFAGGVKAAF